MASLINKVYYWANDRTQERNGNRCMRFLRNVFNRIITSFPGRRRDERDYKRLERTQSMRIKSNPLIHTRTVKHSDKCVRVHYADYPGFVFNNVLKSIRAGLKDANFTDINFTILWQLNDVERLLRASKTVCEGIYSTSTFRVCDIDIKLQITINGHGVGRGSHLSAFIVFMPGFCNVIPSVCLQNMVSFTVYNMKAFPMEAAGYPYPDYRKLTLRPDEIKSKWIKDTKNQSLGFLKLISHEDLLKFCHDDIVTVSVIFYKRSCCEERDLDQHFLNQIFPVMSKVRLTERAILITRNKNVYYI